ncbi:MAG: YfhO family protein [Pirellulales bacterium]|nr:YfhO family protein [Pirellulales bacterium]
MPMRYITPNHESARRTDHDVFVWLLASIAGVLFVLAAPAINGHFYTHDDLAEFHLPVRAFYAECLAQGFRFDWMPNLYAGLYLTGEGQAGTYHPLHLALYRVLPLQAAIALEILISYPLILAGTYFLLRRHGLPRSAAIFGGALFCFSGFSLLHFAHVNAMAVIAHIPWLLLAIRALLTANDSKTRGWAMIAIAGLTGSQLLLGYPQYVWFSLLIEGVYAVWICSRAVDLLWLLPPKVIGAMLGAIQLLPTIDAARHSTRSTVDASFSTAGSLHPANLIQLVAPYLFETRVVGQNTHELGLYAGAVPLVLVAWLLSNWKHVGRFKSLAIASFAVAAAAILYAFGHYGLFYQWQSYLPMVDKFRFPSRAIFVFHLATACLSAIALAVLLRRDPELTSFKHVKSVVAGSLAVALICPLFLSDHVASPILVAAGPILVGLAAALLYLASKGSRRAIAAIAVFAIADLAAYGVSYSIANKTMAPREYTSILPAPSDEPQARLVGEPNSAGTNGPRVGNWMLLAGWHRVDGYAGLEPAKQLNYDSVEAMRVSGAQYVFDHAYEEPAAGLRPLANGLLAVPTPLPRVRLVPEAIVTDDVSADVGRIDHAVAALVDEPIDLPKGVPGTALIKGERPGALDIQTNSSSRQLLVIADSYHPDWKATINGQPITVVRTNGDFLGCVVPPGEHLVQLRFEPRSLRIGAIVTFCGLGLWMSLLFVTRLKVDQRVGQGSP